MMGYMAVILEKDLKRGHDALVQWRAAARELADNGYRLIAAFDVAQSEVGKEISGIQIRHIDELEAFDYETYKANGFKMKHLGDYDLTLETKPEE